MRELSVKPQDTRDILARIDAVAPPLLELDLQRRLQESVFPLVEDGNGPGYFMGFDGNHAQALVRGEVVQNLACGDDEDCTHKLCMRGAQAKGMLGVEMHTDPFAYAVWEANNFFCIGRNDADVDGDAEALGMDYVIVNAEDDISATYCEDCGNIECMCYWDEW